MKIRFRFTARDLAISVVRTVDCGIWPRSTWTVRVLVAVLVSLVLTTLYFGWCEGRLGPRLVELTLPLALLFLVFAFLIRHLRRVIVKSAMAQKETHQFLGDHEAEILEDGLWHKTPVAEALHPWRSLLRVERRGDYAFVWMEKNSLALSLNRNSMTEGDFDRFVETLARMVHGREDRRRGSGEEKFEI